MFAHSFVVPLLNKIGKSVVKHLLPVNGVEMKVKWKCVWRVLKPKIIAALIVILSAIVICAAIFLIGSYWISTFPSPDFTNMSSAQQQQIIATSCGGCGFSVSALIAFLLIIVGGIGIIFLSIEFIKSLAEALKPCIVWEEKK